ncbi:MAG: ricin-type beta-trefoil lectin domain protein [Acidobacteriales bacterium]|nr:ricin-type beta-trefoil lectin domain protein [Terriglobales bacterium]
MLLLTSSLRRLMLVVLPILMPVAISVTAVPSFGASHPVARQLAATPPMGWNDWAHYQCNYTAQDILSNARALVKTGLAAHGYDTVTIDDCWMQKDRDASGNLQADPQRFPQGIKPVAEAVHALGLKFGIYEDAGYLTCGKFAGSGEPDGGGKDHFAQDARLFASWGVDYLKLDGCNLYVPKGGSMAEVYRKAYAAQSAALKTVKRPIVFSESAPAYFQGQPDWYDVLSWVRGYGELWREGDDIANYHAKNPSKPRFDSVLWNYAYNLPLGRFQKPGNWNDADFIIGGDDGMSAAETRSQVALWSMMSAPLILSSDVEKLSPQSVAVVGNKSVIAIDQDALGRMATLVRRSLTMDVLLKPLSGGDYAVTVLNRSTAPVQVGLYPADLGFSSGCELEAQNLWSGKRITGATSLQSDVAAHDTVIWKIHPAASCGTPKRTGTITMIATGKQHDIKSYSRCLSATGGVGDCDGSPAETWTVAANGALESAGRCLAVSGRKLVMQACSAVKTPRWKYTLVGNLIDRKSGQCLSANKLNGEPDSLSMQACGHNQPNQIWSLPN